jgi:hypothetical protein
MPMTLPAASRGRFVAAEAARSGRGDDRFVLNLRFTRLHDAAVGSHDDASVFGVEEKLFVGFSDTLLSRFADRCEGDGIGEKQPAFAILKVDRVGTTV